MKSSKLWVVVLFSFSLFSAVCQAGTSNSLLDVSPDGKKLLAANTDNDSVTVIDTTTNKALREIPVGDQPEGVTWIGNGPEAAVTLFRDNAVVFFNSETGQVLKKLTVPGEPYGIVADKAGQRAWVTHETPGLVTEIDLKAQKVLRQLPAGASVRGIALSPDEKRIYVTEFFTGILNAIDRESGAIVDSWKGHSTDNLCRSVALHPSRPKAYLPHIRSMINVHQGNGSIFPRLSFVDLKPGKQDRRVSFAMDTFNSLHVVTNPWEVALTPDGKRIFILYAGTNEMNVCQVIDDDYKEIDSSNPVQLGNNPRAVRVSPDGKTAYVYNSMDFNVTVYNERLIKVATIPVCPPAKTPEWVRGKILFNTALPPMTLPRWIACSSCHPDGHHDGRTWQQPEGIRNTTALFGQAHTHPLHWSGDRDETQDFEYTIRGKLMQGIGLAKGPVGKKIGFEKAELKEKLSGRSKDLDALAIYCNTFEFPLSPFIPAPGKLSESAQRGKAIFLRKDVGCASCHTGPHFTDSRLQEPYNLHDIGTGHEDVSEKMGTAYDTPTLLGLYRSAPFLHDGKAKNLQEVLTVFNKEDKHGKTSGLSPREIDDLVDFLKSLPYEPTPEVTPNTVTFRVTNAKKEDGK